MQRTHFEGFPRCNSRWRSTTTVSRPHCGGQTSTNRRIYRYSVHCFLRAKRPFTLSFSRTCPITACMPTSSNLVHDQETYLVMMRRSSRRQPKQIQTQSASSSVVSRPSISTIFRFPNDLFLLCTRCERNIPAMSLIATARSAPSTVNIRDQENRILPRPYCIGDLDIRDHRKLCRKV